MARREVGEINAGSMADIAFLLLIFFLVTTTMEVDAGLGRQLPLKIEYNGPPPPPINERNVLKIMANSNDDLLVEDRRIEIEDLYEVVLDFYTINKNGEVDINMPLFTKVTVPMCQKQITDIEALLLEDEENKMLKSELEKWKTKLDLATPTGSYEEMNKSSVIQLKNQAGTSYGLYMEIQNVLKQVVNELRVETCEKMGWPDYFDL